MDVTDQAHHVGIVDRDSGLESVLEEMADARVPAIESDRVARVQASHQLREWSRSGS
jgi:hypothetical protein